MRRGIAATALVASLALAATACGGSGGTGGSSGPVTITWWDTSNATNEAPAYQALVKRFEAADKGIKPPPPAQPRRAAARDLRQESP